jgi:hypothetical protein
MHTYVSLNQKFTTEGATVLKFSEATKAKDRVSKAENDLSQAQNELVEQCNQLYILRSEVGRVLVADFEAYMNTLASRPKEYDRTLELYHLNLQQFDNAGKVFSEVFTQQIRNAATVGSATAGLGAAAGAATAFGAPTAALAIATTFGTASTGTAIASLTGAAATKAALAWLGGGALTAGGGGMAAGNTLLALAGPVGLALAGTTLAAGLGYAAYKNRSTIDEATDICVQLSETHSLVQTHSLQVSGLYGLTVEHTYSLRQLFDGFRSNAPKNYLVFSDGQKEMLGAMHNNVLALSRLLKVKPGEMADLVTPVEDSELNTKRGEAAGDYKPNFVFHSAIASGNPMLGGSIALMACAGPLTALKRILS